MLTSEKHFWLSGVWAPPAVVERVIAASFPMIYLAEPRRANELVSKVEGATVIDVVKDMPDRLIKKSRANELRDKF